MWLYICSKCGWKIEAEAVEQCPKCGARSWLCHNLDMEVETPTPLEFEDITESTEHNKSPVKPEQLSLL